MSEPQRQHASRAQALRAEFDQAFAMPAKGVSEATEKLLAIRVGGDLYALRLSELAAVAKRGVVVPVPSAKPALLGIAGIEGRAVPVFSLALLLGYSAPDAQARWLALCDARDPVGLAFSVLEGHFQFSAKSLEQAAERSRQSKHLGSSVRLPVGLAALVQVSTLVAEIKGTAGPAGASKER